MKKILPWFVFLAVFSSPVFACGRYIKNGRAVSQSKSSAETQNFIQIKAGSQSERLFSALTSSTGSTETFAVLDGDKPLSFGASAFESGNATASGFNKGRIGSKRLPKMKGVSQSAQSAESVSVATLLKEW